MLYVIMCGGTYFGFDKPRQLLEIHGEPLIVRTIRLLEENGVNKDDIVITANDERFQNFGVAVYFNENNHWNVYKKEDGSIADEGYWLNAFVPFARSPVCYLFGDVYYTKEGMERIIHHQTVVNTLYGTIDTRLKPWEEPLAYKVYNPTEFFEGIKKAKEMYDKGLVNRNPIVWELYRVLNGIDINKHILKAETYIHVTGGGMDIDSPNFVKVIEEYYDPD